MQKENDRAVERQKERASALAVERRNILALPAERALDAVLDHPYPVTLIQSMAEEDLYMLIHSIGPEDALPVLGIASNSQWEYLLDMEIWSRDRIDPHAMTIWLDRLLKADPDRFTHWIANEQRDAFEYYLFRNIDVHVREYEQDPAEVGEGFSTEDDVHYIRPRPYSPQEDNFVQKQELRDQFLTDLLKRLSVCDYMLYQGVLLESATTIPGEAEEELLRLRNVRLAEKGFLPFEEAVGVYQPIAVSDLAAAKRKPHNAGGRALESVPLRVAPEQLPDNADYFMRTLARMQDELALQGLQAEFAGLCNQVIAADQKIVREKATLAQTVAKVSGYLSIGLEKADAQAPDKAPYRAANLIQDYLLADIFRVGYGCALALKWRAERWRHGSWFARAGLTPTFWGEAWLGVLGGLLIKKPLFYDNYASGVLYREFATLADIQATEAVLDQIIAGDELLGLMAVKPDRLETYGLLTFQNLMLTLWANYHLDPQARPPMPQALTVDQFRKFFEPLWEPGPLPRRIKDSARQDFLVWLAERCDLAPDQITQRVGMTLEDLFAQMESEFGGVEPHAIDPRYVQLFLLKTS